MKSIKLDLNNNAKWSHIKGYPNYIVSDDGRVANLKTGRVLSQHLDRGYPKVTLSCKGVLSTKKVHRLVLEAFVGECPEGLMACHNDDIKTNNHVGNLRWDTRSENGKDRHRNGTFWKSKNLQLGRDGQLLMQAMSDYGFSKTKIAKFFGFTDASTRNIINEKGRWAVNDPFDFLDDF